MQYFLIRQNNELEHLPGFCVVPCAETSADAPSPDAARPISNGRAPAQFVCPQRSPQMPLSFLVVDEEAIVRVCSGRMLKTGSADFVLTGIITDEYEAPSKAQALRGIETAVAVIGK